MSMKYIIGSLIISFGILLVGIIVMMAINIRAPENGLQYFGIAWITLAVVVYPFSKKIVRD